MPKAWKSPFFFLDEIHYINVAKGNFGLGKSPKTMATNPTPCDQK
jgi:hypothetical protein